MKKITHINKENKPSMVDISNKEITKRIAHAQSFVSFPKEVIERFVGGDIETAKGPVFATAIIAGIMAAKKTYELIPFCHPIGMDDCQVNIELDKSGKAKIDCICKVTHRTGIEMEAMVGASVAALTVYDMIKAISQDIVIEKTRLVSKIGGKEDFNRDKS
ncbi:MAG: cyclic pyranopterin monophosphate synthase MoaC [Pseudomonadota bacterium]|nr:cyclic pyranopterin monophosphate synthase MoaC [Pseudomonadota bacterium]